MLKNLKSLSFSGKTVLPLIEGGKGISVSNGVSAGAWAQAGGVGTFSAVNADYYDENGRLVALCYKEKTRMGRHFELLAHGVKGGIAQAKTAYEMASGNGRIHMNVLWEMAGVEHILNGVLEKTSGLIHGITCGAGMPFRLAQIAAQYSVYYYPIVSSARAFQLLWRRAYRKFSHWLGGVVYEDPWKAGGHNGLSNQENPLQPQRPYERIVALRKAMTELDLGNVPIVMAGGVWCLSEWQSWLDDPAVGPIGFQFGTRPLLTKESPISDEWKAKLPLLQKGDVELMNYSPTGFYASAVRNSFLKELAQRSDRQVCYSDEKNEIFNSSWDVYPYEAYVCGNPAESGFRKRELWLKEADVEKVQAWAEIGYVVPLKTPDHTVIFLDTKTAGQIKKDQINCMGCLSQCRFSNWKQPGSDPKAKTTTGRLPDPRSFCIQKTLQNIAHGAPIDHELMFSGHNVYRFSTDPMYQNGYIPTVKELVDGICEGR